MTDEMSNALPGFEELVRTAVDRAGQNDFTANKYTAQLLLSNYPETFKSIATAIFKYNLPNRVIRDLYRCNGATVRGVHDMVMGAASTDGRGRFLMKCRAASTKSIVITRLLDAILDKLDDPNVVKEMSVYKLTEILGKLSPNEPGEKDSRKQPIDVTPVPEGEDFDAIINGLAAPKKCAALGASVDGQEDGSQGGEIGQDCSTSNVRGVNGSL